MSKLKLILIFSIFVFYNCGDSCNRAIIMENMRIVGNISSDTVFNGVIRYYDLETGRLMFKREFINGVLNGKETEFYRSGEKYCIASYENGKRNGPTYFFDTQGKLFLENNFYYDLLVGNSIYLKDGKPTRYTFFSLDNRILLELNYIDQKDLRGLFLGQKGVFFISRSAYSTSLDSLDKTTGEEYFLYTPNPPGFNFNYSLIKRDKGLKGNEIVIKKFDSSMPWSKFSIEKDSLIDTNMNYYLKLSVYDSVVKENAIMLKNISTLEW